jgi:hypothetical protein
VRVVGGELGFARFPVLGLRHFAIIYLVKLVRKSNSSRFWKRSSLLILIISLTKPNKNQSTTMINQPYIKTVFESLPLDIWYEILSLLDIPDALAISKADPRTFGALIEDKQAIRNSNAFKSQPIYLFRRVLGGTAVGYSSFLSFLQRRLYKTCIVPPIKLFCDISLIIALKDKGFVTASSILSDWDVSLKGVDESFCSVRWKLLYRGVLFGFGANDFHRACDEAGKFVVVVRAENGRIAVAYNEDGFSSDYSTSPNQNGFIVSIEADGSCGARFDRNGSGSGIWNHAEYGPVFFSDLIISSNCHENEESYSRLGSAYGEGAEASRSALFGQENFRVSEYEVFKINIE